MSRRRSPCSGRCQHRSCHQLGRPMRARTGALTRPCAAAQRDQRHLLFRVLHRPLRRRYEQRDLLAGRGPDGRRECFSCPDHAGLCGLHADQYKLVFNGTAGSRAGGLDATMHASARGLSCSICAPIHSNVRKSGPAPTTSGSSSTRSSLSLSKLSWRRTWQHSGTFPPRQRPGSFSVEQAMEMLTKPKGSN
jgi:hypothetical protein